MIIFPVGIYQLPITGIAAVGRIGYGPNGVLAVCSRTTPRTSTVPHTGTIEHGHPAPCLPVLLSWKGQVWFDGRSRDRAGWGQGPPAPVYRGRGATLPNLFGGGGPHNPIS